MTPAVDFLNARARPFELLRFESAANGDYALEAADALGLPAHQIFKTLIAETDDANLVAALVPAPKSLNLKALARLAGCRRATMADVARAERSTGYVSGGISPFGQKRPLATFVDESALELPTMLVSAGRRGLEIRLPPSELLAALDARTGAIAR